MPRYRSRVRASHAAPVYMIHIYLKQQENTPNTRGNNLLFSTLDLHGIEYQVISDPTTIVSSNLVITDYFLNDTPYKEPPDEEISLRALVDVCERKRIPILWYYPGECWYTDATAYNPTGRLAGSLTVPTYLLKSGTANDHPDMQGYTKIFNLDQYHIYQVSNKFNAVRLHSIREVMKNTRKDRKVLYLNGVARIQRKDQFESIRSCDGLLDRAIWSWRDLKGGIETQGHDPEVNWQADRLMINQFRYQCLYPEHYTRTEFSLVVETAQGEIFFSEKTSKCLVLGHPFVLHADPGSLAMLRSWGYETFENVIDQTYDTVEFYHGKSDVITQEVSRLFAVPDVFHACLPQTEHNFRHSMYLSTKIYKDLADIVSQATAGQIRTNFDLPNLTQEQIQKYMSE